MKALAVIDRHEVSLRPNRDDYARIILAEIECGGGMSQRALSQKIGIALGLTNLLLKQTISKGWIRIRRVRRNRVMYLLTPAGMAEKARMTRAHFAASMRYYVETRQRVRERFQDLAAEWHTRGPSDGPRRIAFYEASEVAEIGYVCLQETDFRLVQVFDASRSAPFFGIPVERPERLYDPLHRRFDRLVVMSFGDVERLRATLDATPIRGDDVFWL